MRKSIWIVICALVLMGLVYSSCTTEDEDTGVLSITTTPISGDIYVNGEKKSTGSWTGSLDTGTYVVGFGAVAGYQAPTDQTVEVRKDQTITVTGTYIPDEEEYGTLNVWTSPVSGDIFVNGTMMGNGSWTGELSPGTYTVSFGDVAGYYTPAAVQVTIVANQQMDVEGVYTEEPPQTGTLVIWTTNAAGDIYVDDVYRGNSSVQIEVAAGEYKVSFGAVPDFETPADQWPNVEVGQTVYVEGVYTFLYPA